MMIAERPIENPATSVPDPAVSRVGRDDGDQWAVMAGLRFFLAIVVMLGHLDSFSQVPVPLRYISNFSAYQAVFVFFAISGFSISASIDRSSKDFYSRRFKRIYPTYFVGLIVACVPFLVWGPALNSQHYYFEAPFTIWPVIASFFMLQGIAIPIPLSTFSQSWSLSIECVCYLFAPLLCRMKDRTLVLFVAISFLAYIKRDIFGHLQNPMGTMFGIATIECIWAWIAGVLIYRHKDSRIVAWSLTTVMAYAMGSLDGSGNPFSPAYLIAAMAIVTNAHRIHLPSWLRRAALYGGDLSLSIYLIHWQTYCFVGHWLPSASPWLLILSALLAAIAVLHLVDRPYAAYAKRVEQNRAKVLLLDSD